MSQAPGSSEALGSVIRFDGVVECQAGTAPLALLLTGQSGGLPAELAFATAAAPPLPPRLQAPQVESLRPGAWRISAGSAQWTVEAASIHLHRNVAAVFYRAVPPRPVPWRKRLFFRTLLAFAATPAAAWLLARRRRPGA